MKEYKVKVVYIVASSLSMKKYLNKTQEELQKTLDELALEGWHLVSTEKSANSNVFYLFMERDIRNQV